MNCICDLLNIKYPVIQGGMVWCSGWELASAASEAGGLGLIGAGSMNSKLLKYHIQRAKNATLKPVGVNIPLLKKGAEELIDTVIEEKVPVVFTSAGNPALWTQRLKDNGSKVVHVVSNTRFAEKAEKAGVDAIVVEGFEAGGHNGREETTIFTLLPLIRSVTGLPLIAAGGIGSGKAMLAAMILGADGVQLGSLFAVSEESSAHLHFKQKICEINEGDTRLILKSLSPVRMVVNELCNKLSVAENQRKTPEELLSILGSGKEKIGIFEGDLEQGELEIGQVSALIKTIKPVKTIIKELMDSYYTTLDYFRQNDNKYNF